MQFFAIKQLLTFAYFMENLNFKNCLIVGKDLQIFGWGCDRGEKAWI